MREVKHLEVKEGGLLGEAKRKAETKAEAIAGLEQAALRAHTEGQGVWELEVIDCRNIPDILLGQLLGDKRCHEMAEVMAATVPAIHNPTQGADYPTLCLTCNTAFTPTSQPPEAFIVVRGANPDGQQLIANVLCAPCHHHPDAKQRVFDRLRRWMIPDLREIHVSPNAGHA
jgi:hypothetical protein